MSGWITWITGDSNVDLASAQRVIQELVAERDELKAGAGVEKLLLQQQQLRIRELEDTVKAQSKQIALLTRRCSAYCHVLDAEQHIMAALRSIDDAKVLVVPSPVVICCPSPKAFSAVAAAAAAAAPAAIDIVTCPVAVCNAQGNAASSLDAEGLLGANVVNAQEFQTLHSSGDVFLHGDTPSFAWAYSCRELETLQVAGSTALIFGSVAAVARLRQASLAARCVLVRSMLVDGEQQPTEISETEFEQLFDAVSHGTTADAIALDVVNFLQKRR